MRVRNLISISNWCQTFSFTWHNHSAMLFWKLALHSHSNSHLRLQQEFCATAKGPHILGETQIWNKVIIPNTHFVQIHWISHCFSLIFSPKEGVENLLVHFSSCPAFYSFTEPWELWKWTQTRRGQGWRSKPHLGLHFISADGSHALPSWQSCLAASMYKWDDLGHPLGTEERKM